ncbi:hypothetical protein D3C83_131700 [compost metagenome]
MKSKKRVCLLKKTLFLDGIADFVYAACAIAGIFLIVESLYNATAWIVALGLSIPAATFIGIFGARKMNRYFDGDADK